MLTLRCRGQLMRQPGLAPAAVYVIRDELPLVGDRLPVDISCRGETEPRNAIPKAIRAGRSFGIRPHGLIHERRVLDGPRHGPRSVESVGERGDPAAGSRWYGDER